MAPRLYPQSLNHKSLCRGSSNAKGSDMELNLMNVQCAILYYWSDRHGKRATEGGGQLRAKHGIVGQRCRQESGYNAKCLSSVSDFGARNVFKTNAAEALASVICASV